jgi:hypothetical protein
MLSIFLSYRRDDSIDAAGRIYDRLVDHFGGESVFMDVDSIPLGIDFKQYLQDAVSRCDILLAVIGQGWLEARPREGPLSGQRRLDNPDDFFRIEIQTALARGIAVVPVLVGRATMPVAKDLPDELKDLAFRNAAEVRPGKDFHDHVDRLIRGIESMERAIDLTVPGEWLARPAEETKAEWIKVHLTPAKVLPRPDEIYCLKVAGDVADRELVGLVKLRGLHLPQVPRPVQLRSRDRYWSGPPEGTHLPPVSRPVRVQTGDRCRSGPPEGTHLPPVHQSEILGAGYPHRLGRIVAGFTGMLH